MKTGLIRMMEQKKKFGFIKSGKEEYFFHKDDLIADWDNLYYRFQVEPKESISVQFFPDKTEKGLRARNVEITN